MLIDVAPNGKSYKLAINEYSQGYFRTDVIYVCDKCESGFSATTILDGLTYATERSPNKFEAKMMAARATAEVILPEFRCYNYDKKLPESLQLLAFDNVDLADERIPELTMPHEEIKPYRILIKCLERNFGFKEKNIEFITHAGTPYINGRLTMSVGSYSVCVPMSRFAKQEASHSILTSVHPRLESYGALIRMYIVNDARYFSEMAVHLEKAQNVVIRRDDDYVAAMVPEDAVAEDKGEPALLGQQDEESDSDDNEESEADHNEDEQEEGGNDDDEESSLGSEDEDEGEEEDEDDEEEEEDEPVSILYGAEYKDELDELEALAAKESKAPAESPREVNFCITPLYNKISFGDLPAIGDDFEERILGPPLTGSVYPGHTLPRSRGYGSLSPTWPPFPKASVESQLVKGAPLPPSDRSSESVQNHSSKSDYPNEVTKAYSASAKMSRPFLQRMVVGSFLMPIPPKDADDARINSFFPGPTSSQYNKMLAFQSTINVNVPTLHSPTLWPGRPNLCHRTGGAAVDFAPEATLKGPGAPVLWDRLFSDLTPASKSTTTCSTLWDRLPASPPPPIPMPPNKTHKRQHEIVSPPMAMPGMQPFRSTAFSKHSHQGHSVYWDAISDRRPNTSEATAMPTATRAPQPATWSYGFQPAWPTTTAPQDGWGPPPSKEMSCWARGAELAPALLQPDSVIGARPPRLCAYCPEDHRQQSISDSSARRQLYQLLLNIQEMKVEDDQGSISRLLGFLEIN